MSSKKSQELISIDVPQVEKAALEFHILGTQPLLFNAMSAKSKRELLLPKGRKNAADKASTAKHDVLQEYRSSCYMTDDPEAPTKLLARSLWFKSAITGCGTDIPGMAKAALRRLTYVENEYTPLYGKPMLHMGTVVSSGRTGAPDIRTRMIVPQWATKITLQFVTPLLKAEDITNLVVAAGVIRGVGDWRPERGGQYGTFEIVAADDPRYQKILKQDRAIQEEGYEVPEPYDVEVGRLYDWYTVEANRRGLKVAS